MPNQYSYREAWLARLRDLDNCALLEEVYTTSIPDGYGGTYTLSGWWERTQARVELERRLQAAGWLADPAPEPEEG